MFNHFDDVVRYMPLILSGAFLTLQLALVTLALSMVLGLIGASMMMSKVGFIRRLAVAYSTVIRGVPDLVWMLLIYYGAQILINDWADRLEVVPIELNPFMAGVLTLSVIFGAYFSETFRGAILAVPKGLPEAGHAYGMSPWQVFKRITFPLLMRFALPGIRNNWQVLIKSTALVSIIGLDDMTRITDQAGGAVRASFLFGLVAAALFLAMTSVSFWVFRKLEVKYARGVRGYSYGK